MNWRTSVLMFVLIVFVIGGALVLGLSGSQSAANGCRSDQQSTSHSATIKDGKVSDSRVNAKLCDTLTITNQDNGAREIAFGAHERHISYDGVAERVLGKGQSLTVTLNKTGSYHWHDHLHDEVEGYFTVTE